MSVFFYSVIDTIERFEAIKVFLRIHIQLDT